MDGRFLTAFIVPERWDILGYKLRPFSLRHMLYLTALKSPFLVESESSPRPDDILVFLRVCSAEHPSKAFRPPTLMDRWRVSRMTLDSGYMMAAQAKIMAFIEECSSAPVVYKKKEEKQKLKEGVPSCLSMATALMSKMNLPLEQAWDTPVGQAIWYLTSFAISEGSEISILTTQDEDSAEADKALLKKIEAQMLAKIKENNGRK